MTASPATPAVSYITTPQQWVMQAIKQTRINLSPFPNFYVREIFPPEFYADMLSALPPESAYKVPVTIMNAGPERVICDVATLPGQPWKDLYSWMGGNEFAQFLVDKFKPHFFQRFGRRELAFRNDLRLVRDYQNYKIKPHTDVPAKAISLLFYLPSDESMADLGTSLYVPKDAAFRCDGRGRHPFEAFTKVWTAPFVPNAMLGFFKHEQAFHGVESIERPIVRNVLLYNLYAQAVA